MNRNERAIHQHELSRSDLPEGEPLTIAGKGVKFYQELADNYFKRWKSEEAKNILLETQVDELRKALQDMKEDRDALFVKCVRKTEAAE